MHIKLSLSLLFHEASRVPRLWRCNSFDNFHCIQDGFDQGRCEDNASSVDDLKISFKLGRHFGRHSVRDKEISENAKVYMHCFESKYYGDK